MSFGSSKSWESSRVRAPIGVFDSGAGGVSVLAELRAALPHEDLLYLGDTANAPYGFRPDDEVRALTLRGVRWLRARGAKLVVIACNTACAAALTEVRAEFGSAVPVVGLVPALKPAVALTRTGHVGVLATPVTLRGRLMADVTASFAVPAGVRVHGAAHAALVPLVEAGVLSGPEVERALREALGPLVEAGVDVLVLGCTHYPFLRGAIETVFPGVFTVLDSGRAVARHTTDVLRSRSHLAPDGAGRMTLVSSGAAGSLLTVAGLVGLPDARVDVVDVTDVQKV